MTINAGIVGAIIGTISLIIGGLLGFIVNNLKKEIDGKQDKAVCVISHQQIKEEMNRGQKNFDSILASIKSLETQLAKNNTEISLLTQTIKSLF